MKGQRLFVAVNQQKHLRIYILILWVKKAGSKVIASECWPLAWYDIKNREGWYYLIAIELHLIVAFLSILIKTVPLFPPFFWGMKFSWDIRLDLRLAKTFSQNTSMVFHVAPFHEKKHPLPTRTAMQKFVRCQKQIDKRVKKITAYGQWSFLVPLIGGRWCIMTRLAIYKWYISGIYCQSGDYISPTTY